jgi:predicted RNA-binding Zn ribbon-like protein
MDRNEVWRDGFLFVGNQVALDFVNTRPMIDGGYSELLPDVDALLRWFVAAELIDVKTTAGLRRKWRDDKRAAKVLDSLREFRERLREDLIAWEEGQAVRRSTVSAIDDLLARYPMRRRLVTKDREISTETWVPIDDPDDLYAPLANAAAQLFAEVDRTRVRKCSNCILHFMDSSKKGNRQWCSMQLCGNRAKVAAYTERQRSKSKRN